MYYYAILLFYNNYAISLNVPGAVNKNYKLFSP